MSFPGAVPQDAATVPVRVQVIDMDPFALDLVIPSYLAVKDLTQRMARDAGLGAYWEDGSRRIFYLRARGRVLHEDEKLQDLGIVPYELLHLLPQPPVGSGVQERPPEYPPTTDYTAGGNLNMLGGLMLMLGWVGAWAYAWGMSHGPLHSLLPAAALGLLCTSFARHMLGGVGSSMRVPVVGALLYVPLMGISAALAVLTGDVAAIDMGVAVAMAFVAGMFGVMLSWLAWYGAVEPLPKVTVAHVMQAEQQAVYPCGICGLDVYPDVRSDCRYACGRVFHKGCISARESVSNIQGCAVCGYNPNAGAPAA